MTPTEIILQAYEERQTITGIHKITGYSWQRISKTLSTYGIVVNDTQVLILDLHDKGYDKSEIANRTGFSVSTVEAYLPRVRPAYKENQSVNAKRIEKCRKSKRENIWI